MIDSAKNLLTDKKRQPLQTAPIILVVNGFRRRLRDFTDDTVLTAAVADALMTVGKPFDEKLLTELIGRDYSAARGVRAARGKENVQSVIKKPHGVRLFIFFSLNHARSVLLSCSVRNTAGEYR